VNNTLTTEEVINYLNSAQHGDITIRNITKNLAFKDALESEVGKLLLKDLISLLDNNFMKIWTFKHNNELTIEQNYHALLSHITVFKAGIDIVGKWRDTLKEYFEDCKKVKDVNTKTANIRR
jgi:hypothetical protein